MPRAPVRDRIDQLLADGTRHTHLTLACEVYDTMQPTAAQLAAVRRAVATLVHAGRAQRVEWESRSGASWRGAESPSHLTHTRQGRVCSNPHGVQVQRAGEWNGRTARTVALRDIREAIAAEQRARITVGS